MATLGLGLLGAAAGWGGTGSTVWVDREASVMGSRLRVVLGAETEAAAATAVDLAFETAVALERRLFATDVESDLGLVNGASPGTAVLVSPETFDLLLRAWDYAGRTDGAFDPTVGPLVDAWGDVGLAPNDETLDRALASTGRRCFDLSPASRTVARRCPDAWLDVHGVGKGAVLAAIDAALAAKGIANARIDFGRQTLLRGDVPGAAGVIDIPVPGRASERAFVWSGASGSVAIRSQAAGEAWPAAGPVVDPRTGRPIDSWGAVIVRSDDPVEADALATALLVMGPERGLRWLAARPDIEAAFVVDAVDAGWRACGRQGLVEGWSSVSTEAAVSDRGLLAPGLLACPATAERGDVLLPPEHGRWPGL